MCNNYGNKALFKDWIDKDSTWPYNYTVDLIRKHIHNGGVIIFKTFNGKKESTNMEKTGLLFLSHFIISVNVCENSLQKFDKFLKACKGS